MIAPEQNEIITVGLLPPENDSGKMHQMNDIIILGNYMDSNHDASRIVSVGGGLHHVSKKIMEQ